MRFQILEIESKCFINLHLKLSKTDADQKSKILVLKKSSRRAKVKQPSGSYDRFRFRFFFEVELESGSLLPRLMKRTTKSEFANYPFEIRKARIHGCCNGLFCLSDSQTHILLWNPTISKHWELPIPPNAYTSVYGFWYDDIEDDYRVLRVNEYASGIQIYSLKSNSWRHLPHFPCFNENRCEIITSDAQQVNHALHWMIKDDDIIIAFDVRTKTYKSFPMIESGPGVDSVLGVLDGCLCVMMYLSGFSWVLKRYG
ncbi:OLC1v1006183C1 [Oldenlandia corymbosa var. corymbosa]|uniref:OLC1v1006183C1 n=1 Tax=Oldenlandia corymbosa var. corymbosa TaxID=529605 RepID=A0AAV1DGD3_OLDCO|nr:OLC1v1006183C1 [Oldenlandia corymbosa var. corymbosa]